MTNQKHHHNSSKILLSKLSSPSAQAMQHHRQDLWGAVRLHVPPFLSCAGLRGIARGLSRRYMHGDASNQAPPNRRLHVIFLSNLESNIAPSHVQRPFTEASPDRSLPLPGVMLPVAPPNLQLWGTCHPGQSQRFRWPSDFCRNRCKQKAKGRAVMLIQIDHCSDLDSGRKLGKQVRIQGC